MNKDRFGWSGACDQCTWTGPARIAKYLAQRDELDHKLTHEIVVKKPPMRKYKQGL